MGNLNRDVAYVVYASDDHDWQFGPSHMGRMLGGAPVRDVVARRLGRIAPPSAVHRITLTGRHALAGMILDLAGSSPAGVFILIPAHSVFTGAREIMALTRAARDSADADIHVLSGYPKGIEAMAVSRGALEKIRAMDIRSFDIAARMYSTFNIVELAPEDPLMTALEFSIRREDDFNFYDELLAGAEKPVDELELDELIALLLDSAGSLRARMENGADLKTKKILNKKLNTIERYLQTTEPVSRPVEIQVNPTSMCNIACKICPTIVEKAENKIHLNFDYFEKLRPVLPYVSIAGLSAAGEPLLYPRFKDLVTTLREYDIDVYFITNATVLRPEIIEFVVRAGVSDIIVSIDSFSPEGFDMSRDNSGGKLDKILANLRYLQSLKAELGVTRPNLRFQAVMMRSNIHDHDGYIRHAAELGCRKIVLTYLRVVFPEFIDQSLYWTREESNRKMLDWVNCGARYGVDVEIPNLFNEAAGRRLVNRSCFEPWRSLMLDVRGTVYSCLCYMNAYGNVRGQTLEEARKSPGLERLRATVNAETRPAACRSCSYKYSQDVDDRASHFMVPLDAPRGSIAAKSR